uniref:Putative Lipid A biosynthesis lauroyl acyltransferase n=1 Tax=Magnetococcus massalia (strain MO-1) TaxID=451514 RepID=A0A1S7LF95_MAGMO|nr:putative Lipid A biosynthesis lauroyl acyltransferase [Candidatus Magnetococcus massalia]
MHRELPDRPLKKRLLHRLEWLLVETMLWHLQSCSMATAYRRTRRLAQLGQWLLKGNRYWAETNLQLVFGDHLTPEQREKLVKLAFENIFLSHVEGMRAGEVKFVDEGLDHLHNAMAGGRGAISVSVHLGSWEPGLMHLAKQGHPLTVVYRHASNPLVEERFSQERAAYGLTFVRRDRPREVLATLKRKELLGLMVDINTHEGAVTAPFLGLDAQCPAGPVKLARRFQVPVVPVVAIREGVGEARLKHLPAMAPPTSHESDATYLHRLHAAFELEILRYAEQYNWLHGRFRARPDGTNWRRNTPQDKLFAARKSPFLTPHKRILEMLS